MWFIEICGILRLCKSLFSVVHWDVCNEQLHEDYFENKTGDLDFLSKLFKIVHEHDEDALLFLNDFALIRSGTYTRVSEFFVVDVLRLIFELSPLAGLSSYSIAQQSYH